MNLNHSQKTTLHILRILGIFLKQVGDYHNPCEIKDCHCHVEVSKLKAIFSRMEESIVPKTYD